MCKQFQRPAGHESCKTSTTIYDALSFGTGELDYYGFWQIPCAECARAWEAQFPGSGPCWPHSAETLKQWKEGVL